MNEKILSLQTAHLGSRGSDLALWQTHYVRHLLQDAWPSLDTTIEIISTKGDQILDTPLPLLGGKGLFTAEIEAALLSGAIDAAVHSLKDLPTQSPMGLSVGAIPGRANPADVLVSREGFTLENLPLGATVGTSSHRRASQIRCWRPDVEIADLRGNVPTRIRKALQEDGPYDAIVLAYAGLERLDRLDAMSQVLTLEQMLPAPGQGALAVQCRDDATSLALLSPLDDVDTRAAVTAERGFLSGLGGGCTVPVAAWGRIEDGQLFLQGRVSALDGSRQIDVHGVCQLDQAEKLGLELAQSALEEGAADILEALL
jgi:hydroxymethylbilane synthase